MLQLFCEKLDVADLQEVVPTLQRLTVMAEAYPHLEQVCWQHSSNVHHSSDVNHLNVRKQFFSCHVVMLSMYGTVYRQNV